MADVVMRFPETCSIVRVENGWIIKCKGNTRPQHDEDDIVQTDKTFVAASVQDVQQRVADWLVESA